MTIAEKVRIYGHVPRKRHLERWQIRQTIQSSIPARRLEKPQEISLYFIFSSILSLKFLKYISWCRCFHQVLVDTPTKKMKKTFTTIEIHRQVLMQFPLKSSSPRAPAKLASPSFRKRCAGAKTFFLRRGEKFGTLHEFACHPCAGAMLIFSVSFQF